MRSILPAELKGKLKAEPSKSAMQRSVAIACLARGTTIIRNPSFCDDALASMNIAMGLGAQVDAYKDEVKITGMVHLPARMLDCKESGLCMRMFSPIAALFEQEILLTGKPQLLKRPIEFLEKPLKMLGADIKTTNGFPPVKVKGPLQGGAATIDASVSSQSLTGLLIALALCKNDSRLEVVNLKSKEYVDLTIAMQKQFGVTVHKSGSVYEIPSNQSYKPCEITIEGDWSSASFLLVAGAICGRVELTGLSDSFQPDRKIVDALKSAGAFVKISENSVLTAKSDLSSFKFDATGCPDLFPPLAVLALSCKGTSQIIGVERLKYKESDRAGVLAEEFAKIGGVLRIEGNSMFVEGSKIDGGTIDPHGDHRIAMAGAIAGLVSKNGVTIQNPGCVSKSYPGFFDDLKKLGVKQ